MLRLILSFLFKTGHPKVGGWPFQGVMIADFWAFFGDDATRFKERSHWGCSKKASISIDIVRTPLAVILQMAVYFSGLRRPMITKSVKAYMDRLLMTVGVGGPIGSSTSLSVLAASMVCWAMTMVIQATVKCSDQLINKPGDRAAAVSAAFDPLKTGD